MSIQKKIAKTLDTIDKNKKNQKIESSEIKKLAFIVVLLVAIFFIFYGITCLIIDKEKNSLTPSTEETTIQYDEIIVSTMLKQREKSYYVLLTVEEDKSLNLYDLYRTNYLKLETHDKVYKINLNNPLNQASIAEESKTNINDISELRLKSSTLIKVMNGKISAVYEGKDAIITQFKKITTA